MGKQKAPKAQADAMTWIKQQINDFGIAGIPLRDLISFVKIALGSPNALVRASATQLLVTIKIFVGGDISGFLEDLNPQLLSTINSEFDKAASQTPPEPTRTQADPREVAAGPSKGGKGGADPLDDLVPRVDLDKLVAQTSVIADSRADAWKVRKEAFEALNALLEVKSNQRLKANMGKQDITSIPMKLIHQARLQLFCEKPWPTRICPLRCSRWASLPRSLLAWDHLSTSTTKSSPLLSLPSAPIRKQ
jgi:cytoskeleton-associated protein 5